MTQNKMPHCRANSKNKILKSQEKSQSLPVVHMYALVPGLVHAL